MENYFLAPSDKFIVQLHNSTLRCQKLINETSVVTWFVAHENLRECVSLPLRLHSEILGQSIDVLCLNVSSKSDHV